METPNPYQPPAQHEQPPPPSDLPEGWVACPQCRGTSLDQPSFTWWGGALGPKLLNHVKCLGCGTTFNAKTGNSNTPAIVIYQVVVFAVMIALLFVFGLL